MLFVFIAGASASGKTEIATQLVEQLGDEGIVAKKLSMDNYYKSQRERGMKIDINFDEPAAYNLDLFHEQLHQLDEARAINSPLYCFQKKDRLSNTEIIDPSSTQVMVIEGILALHQVDALKLKNKLMVFVETDSYLAILKRRASRDEVARATSPEETRKRELGGVRDAFFAHILPSKSSANLVVSNNDKSIMSAPSQQGTNVAEAVEQVMAEIKLKLSSFVAAVI